MTDTDPQVRAAKVLAEKFTVGTGERNRNWDPDLPDDENNPYYHPIPMEKRVEQGMFVHFIASDGHPSIRAVSPTEAVSALAEAGLLVCSCKRTHLEPAPADDSEYW